MKKENIDEENENTKQINETIEEFETAWKVFIEKVDKIQHLKEFKGTEICISGIIQTQKHERIIIRRIMGVAGRKKPVSLLSHISKLQIDKVVDVWNVAKDPIPKEIIDMYQLDRM